MRCINTLFLALLLYIALITIMRQAYIPDGVNVAILLFLLVATLAVLLFPKLPLAKMLASIRRHPRISQTAAFAMLGAGFAARFSFLLLDYVPISDPSHFFHNAASLAQTGALSCPDYVGMFPYLYAYDVLLAAVFTITGSGLLGVLLLNTALTRWRRFCWAG